jgi:TRAP-type C4-dicarboxylate transport system permease small subunit
MVAFVRWVDRLSIACAALAAVMLALAAIVITWSVIYRFFGASTYWEIEFSVYMMVAALFLASPYTLATNGHVGVDLVSHYLAPQAARRLALLVALIGLAVCLYLAVAGGYHTFESLVRGERTESAWAPYKWPLFLTLPLGLGLTALQYIAELLRRPEPASARSDA